RRSATVTFTVRVAESPIAFVNDHDHLPDRPNHIQDLLEIAFSSAHPLRSEVFQLDRREAAFFRKRFGNEGLARAHWTSKQNAHRHATRPAFWNSFGDHEQVFLNFFHAADNFKTVRRFNKLHESETLALEDLALAFRDQP